MAPTASLGPRPAIPADSVVRSGPVRIHVVYPGPNDVVPSTDSAFLFGSVGRGDATLIVDGAPVAVLGNGAWIAWVGLRARHRERHRRISESSPRSVMAGELP